MSAVSHLAASALLSCCPELTHRDPDYPAGDSMWREDASQPSAVPATAAELLDRGPLGSSSPSHPFRSLWLLERPQVRSRASPTWTNCEQIKPLLFGNEAHISLKWYDCT